MEEIKDWISKIVEVIFDDGKEVSKLTGNLVGFTTDYVIIRTFSNQFCISTNRIIKIKLGGTNA